MEMEQSVPKFYKIETRGKKFFLLIPPVGMKQCVPKVYKIKTPEKNSSCIYRLWRWNRVFRKSIKLRLLGRILHAYTAGGDRTVCSETL